MRLILGNKLLWCVLLISNITINATTFASYANAESLPEVEKQKSSDTDIVTNSSISSLISELATDKTTASDLIPSLSAANDNEQNSSLQSTPNSPRLLSQEESQKITVKKIELTGSSFANSPTLRKLIESVEGKTVSLATLRNLADQITGWYFEQNYITSVAILDESAIQDGIVPIEVIEGTIEEIRIEPPTRRINPKYVRSRVALGVSKPFSQTKLEEQLRLLQLDPLFTKVEGSLRPGTKQGQSILIVRVTEAQPFELILNTDNYSPPSIGSERLGVDAVYRNPIGLGDQLSASYYFSTHEGGSNYYDFSYQVPLNPMNGTLQLRTAINNVKVVQPPFDVFDIRGESELYEINYRQPLWRSLREEFALSLGLSVQNGQTFTFAGPTPFGIGPDANGNSQTRTIRFAQDYVKRDTRGVWGLRSQLNFGIDVFDATINPEPKPDGRFFSWLFQIQRQQRLTQDNLFIAQLDFQLTPDGLLPSEQFVIGGGQSVRGYRQNVRAGDNGLRFSVEDRIVLQRDSKTREDLLQIAPFFDLGLVWNVDNNPNIIQRQKLIAGLGLGVLWKPIPNLNVRLDYGFPLVDLEDRGRNAQDDGFYFNVGYRL
ncbi:ShlB/FhaC/HecB family hemolysin secretion/activation protein [Nostoc sp. FACHB-152]|uniref:ShlB/FhaC/HecB family hemolysin secretion/activation protein n=1 Tax=unclassified Nostoc TaxID=2593658 RepID=UPI0016850275|nr:MULTISPECIES: ShlB/FhaC/HecB family hemolysin secretion/activation protein [unclassified Nostoc]MBD2449258.1 ShlB/FhaC/HecB family hemolysin secretion/activation protein [Nostoc sp. FACHB-152]MBD2470464.1 ShlB/FhaC/HecB family hemolysin secretion/activation protein [Nostoc sp. FACHB-145]